MVLPAGYSSALVQNEEARVAVDGFQASLDSAADIRGMGPFLAEVTVDCDHAFVDPESYAVFGGNHSIHPIHPGVEKSDGSAIYNAVDAAFAVYVS